jgi:hypothetical protein
VVLASISGVVVLLALKSHTRTAPPMSMDAKSLEEIDEVLEKKVHVMKLVCLLDLLV